MMLYNCQNRATPRAPAHSPSGVSGLWSALPDECWALEERISAKQNLPFRLHAPDEAAARAAFEAAHPLKAKARCEREATFEAVELFPDGGA